MTIVRLALTAALCLFGACVDTAAQDDSDSTSQAVNGAPSEGDATPSDKTGPTVPPQKPRATTSAATTCINLHVGYNGPFIVSARADRCQKRNKTWTGVVTFSSPAGCSSDLANCDGRLVCGGC